MNPPPPSVRNPRRAVIVLGVLAGGLAAASIYLWRELDAERAVTAGLRARLAAVPTSPAVPPVVAVPSPATPAPTATPAATTPVAATTAPQQTTGTQEEWNDYRRRMMRDPRYREAQREQNRLALAPRRSNLIRLLGFTPAEADAIIDMQIEREWQREEHEVTITSEDMRLRLRKEAEAREREYQARVQSLYGQERAARLEHYMESRPSRMQVDTFRTQLRGDDMLRDDQIEPLIEALHVDRSRMSEQLQEYRETLNFDSQQPETWQRYEERRFELMKEMHAAMHTSAAGILSSSQLEHLDAMLERDLQRFDAQRRMNQVQSKIDRVNASGSPN